MISEVTNVTSLPIDQTYQPLLCASQGIHREQARARSQNGCEWTLEVMGQAVQYGRSKLLAFFSCLSVRFSRERTRPLDRDGDERGSGVDSSSVERMSTEAKCSEGSRAHAQNSQRHLQVRFIFVCVHVISGMNLIISNVTLSCLAHVQRRCV